MPRRSTRRRIAYWTMTLISLVVARAIVLPDIPPQASGLLMVVVPSLVAIVATFIGGEVAADHSNNKHGKVDE